MKRAYPPVSLRLQVAQASGVELAGLLAHRVSAQIERGIDVDGSYRAAG